MKTHFMFIVDRKHTSLLSAACQMKNLPLVKWCLEQNISWHSDTRGNTPIRYALLPDRTGFINRFLDDLKKSNEIVKELASQKILLQKKINEKNVKGSASLGWAIFSLGPLVKESQSVTEKTSILNVIATLFENGADPHQKDSMLDDISPYEYAEQHGFTAIVKLFEKKKKKKEKDIEKIDIN